MEIESLESQTQAALAQVLNDLQTATLMASALERQLLEAGLTIKRLAQTVENLTAPQNSAQPAPPLNKSARRRSLLLDHY
jgi:hypothetical protein